MHSAYRCRIPGANRARELCVPDTFPLRYVRTTRSNETTRRINDRYLRTEKAKAPKGGHSRHWSLVPREQATSNNDPASGGGVDLLEMRDEQTGPVSRTDSCELRPGASGMPMRADAAAPSRAGAAPRASGGAAPPAGWGTARLQHLRVTVDSPESGRAHARAVQARAAVAGAIVWAAWHGSAETPRLLRLKSCLARKQVRGRTKWPAPADVAAAFPANTAAVACAAHRATPVRLAAVGASPAAPADALWGSRCSRCCGERGCHGRRSSCEGSGLVDGRSGSRCRDGGAPCLLG